MSQAAEKQQTAEQRATQELMRRICPSEHVTTELTWWAEDGTERRGYVNVAPDVSPETLAALARVMEAAEAQAVRRPS